MKKQLSLIAIAAIFAFFCCACAAPYREEDFLGKSSAEIVREFGEFDCVTMPKGEDGLYRSCRCGYTIREPQTGFLGTSEEVLLFISFDENGIAVACEEGYRPGG